MKTRHNQSLPTSALIGALAVVGTCAVTAEVSKGILESISMPDKVETAIGELEFFDGVPNDATIYKLYDNLGWMRGVEVYLNHSGARSLNAMHKGCASMGADASNKFTITYQPRIDGVFIYPDTNNSWTTSFACMDHLSHGSTKHGVRARSNL